MPTSIIRRSAVRGTGFIGYGRKSIEIDAFGHRLLLGLGFADRMMFSNTFPLYEMLPFDPDDRFSVLGLGVHPLCVTVKMRITGPCYRRTSKSGWSNRTSS